MVVASCDHDLFAGVEGNAVDGIVVNVDGSDGLKTPSPRKVSTHWQLSTAPVRVARLTGKHICSLHIQLH